MVSNDAERRSDAEVEWDVRDAIYTDVRIDSANVDVGVRQGIVRLTGSVPSYAQKVLARETAERIKGVVEVVDDLRVEPLLPRTDPDITADVVAALFRDSLVDASKIEVTTNQGVVHLHGTVDSLVEKKVVGDIPRGIRGVVDVVNEVQVMPAHGPTDEELERAVHAAVEGSLRLPPGAVQVQVVDGVAYLRGWVVTPTQWWLAEEAARFVPGVVETVNELQVRPAVGREEE
jgi:osmotically-inducible protein OsmY